MAAPDVNTNHYDLDVPAIVQRADAALLAETALSASPFEAPTPPQDPEGENPNQPAIVAAGTAGTRRKALNTLRANPLTGTGFTPPHINLPPNRAINGSQVVGKNRPPKNTQAGRMFR